MTDSGCEGSVVAKILVPGGGIQPGRDDNCGCERLDSSGKERAVEEVGVCKSKKR